MKKCLECGGSFPLEYFPTKGEGRQHPRCRPCHNARRRRRPDGYVDVKETGGVLEPIPDGFYTKGISTLVGPDGEVKAQWIKSFQDKQKELAALIEAAKIFAEPWAGESVEVNLPPIKPDKDLLAVYPMGDPHAGMYAWAAETGADFDLTIFERDLYAAVDHLVNAAPPAEQALLIELGDFFHADSQANTTTRGTRVDVDSRYAKVLQVGLRTMKRSVYRLLEKHKRIIIQVLIGNHDTQSALCLAVFLSEHFSNNDRVYVDLTPDMFRWHRFGQNLFGMTHGHTVKATELPAIMAHDRQKDWGDTSHRHWYTGHVHHDSVKDYRGCSVETVRTLAPRDAWHHESGYRSKQDMKCDIWHRENGRIARHYIGLPQLRRK